MAEYIEVRVTAGSAEEADRICGAVVGGRLAACAQVVGPIVSTYWWEGQVQRSEEWLLLLKTRAELFDELARSVRAEHSYDVPEIVAVALVDGIPDYLTWITEETSPVQR
ncbi:divalent-cation tolerance protein CutA [Acrocarpospora macrocephala]|nr:divalent-cation tolerance protein CutA [Acrocarpospora macrocephala]